MKILYIWHMIYSDKLANDTAVALLDIEAIKLSPQDPFTWASGWQSPIYCDNRTSLSYPLVRNFIKASLSDLIIQSFPDVNAIAGVATAGIAHGALVADELNLPFIYVRSKPKGHGLGNQIEGRLKGGEKLVVVEDLISSGMSSLKAVDALKAVGAEVLGLAAIFSYAFDHAVEAFKKANCEYYTLSDYHHLLPLALEKELINSDHLDLLKSWRKDPSTWEN